MARVVMLLENNPYPQDVRVRSEAESLVRAGYAVTVIAPRGEGQPRRERVGGVRVRRFWLPETPANPIGFVAEYLVANAWLHLFGLWELFKGARVVHLHNPPDTLFGVGFIARLLGRGVVFDHHDLAPELFEAKFGQSAIVATLRHFERLTFLSASTVLAANESHREIATGRGGLPPARVTVVRNGPPRAALEGATDPRGGTLDDPHLLFLGSMESQDGVDDLVPLLEDLTDRHGLAGARLTMVGEGSRRDDLLAAAAAAGLVERVCFTGLVPHTEVPALLAEADVCVDPAPCTELNQRSTMIKIAEYMAAGRATAAYPLLETRRTAGDAVAYARCDDRASFVDVVAALARDPSRRLELSRLGRQRAGELAWEASEVHLLGAYRALVRR